MECLRDGTRPLRLLEVGANAGRDLERFLPHDDVCYLDLARPIDAEPANRLVHADGCASPFHDRAFAATIALDVLDQVRPERRTSFVAEALRVTAQVAVIGAPFHSPDVVAHEGRLNDYFRDLHGQDVPGLAQHAARGLPSLDDTLVQIRALGWEAVACGAGNLALRAKLMQAHLFVNSQPSLLELLGDVDELYNATLAARDGESPVYRHFIVCVRNGTDLARLAPALAPTGGPAAEDLLRLQERLDRLYETGARERATQARAERAQAEARVHTLAETLAERSAIAALQERLATTADRLSHQAGRLTAQRLALRALWRGFRSRGQALFDRLVTGVRMVGRLSRSRLHEMQIEVLHDVALEADGFRSLGDDPQLLLHSSRRRLPSAWVEVAFAVEPRGQWLSPKLYVDAGRGFSENQSFTLPVRAGRRVECIIRLPERVRALRLDPLAAPGRFVLRDVTMREIGLAQLATAVLPRIRRVPLQLHDFVRLAKRALTIVSTGGVRVLTQRLLAGRREDSEYQDWIEAYDTLTDADRTAIRRQVDALTRRPLISIVMPTYDTPEVWLRRAIESVRGQLYPDWELCIADDGSSAAHVRRVLEEYRASDPRIKVVYRPERGHISAASNSALTLATGELVAFLDHDDELAERALAVVAAELDEHPDTELVYSDEDKLTPAGRRIDPYFKPDWNPDLFLAQNLVTHLCVCRRERVAEVGGFRVGYEGAQDWDLVMRIAERIPASAIRHIPQVLYHWRLVPGSTALAIGEKSYASEAQHRTLTSHFERCAEAVDLLPIAGLCWRVRYPLPDPAPLVTAIIPTRDNVALLQRCVAGLRERTSYPRLEVVVVDNQSVEPETLAFLDELRRLPAVTVLRYDAPFNYSAINNLGARHARGDVLLLLNNDVEVIAAGWLEEMVSQASRPEVGAVGALLYYPNDTIQHAGVIVGLGTSGIAAHAYAYRPRGQGGQLGRPLLTQTMSAVTAACLTVRRQVFEEVGGFDEHLSTAYNDIDLCLRIRDRGYRNLWTPHAELYHNESASRGYENTPAKRERLHREAEYMRRRWGSALLNDPAYNPNLSLEGESFALAFPPRVCKPWLAPAETDEPARARVGDRA